MERRQHAPADRRLGGDQRLRERVRLRRQQGNETEGGYLLAPATAAQPRRGCRVGNAAHFPRGPAYRGGRLLLGRPLLAESSGALVLCPNSQEARLRSRRDPRRRVDRENELMGNLSLHKELDFILKVNEWSKDYPDFRKDHKQVTVRTIKMKQKTADDLQYASKFDRSREFSEKLRAEGCEVGRKWLDDWRKGKAGEYPQDAGYRPITE